MQQYTILMHLIQETLGTSSLCTTNESKRNKIEAQDENIRLRKKIASKIFRKILEIKDP